MRSHSCSLFTFDRFVVLNVRFRSRFTCEETHICSEKSSFGWDRNWDSARSHYFTINAPPPHHFNTLQKLRRSYLCVCQWRSESRRHLSPANRRAMNSTSFRCRSRTALSQNTRTKRIFGRLIRSSYDLLARNISLLTVSSCTSRCRRWFSASYISFLLLHDFSRWRWLFLQLT